MNHDQVYKLIKSVGHLRTVLVQGSMGIGKTETFERLKADFPGHHSLVIDCTQITDGTLYLPDVNREKGFAREITNERLGLHLGKPVLFCFDEIGKMRQYFKDLLAPMIYERRLHDIYFPEGSIVFCTSNLDVENLGDDFQPHLADRMLSVRLFKPTATEWIKNYAEPNALHPAVIQAVKETPECLQEFDEVGAENNPYIYLPSCVGMTQEGLPAKYVTPRGLRKASDLLYSLEASGIDDLVIKEEALKGTVGAAFTQRTLMNLENTSNLPSILDIVRDPLGTLLPEEGAYQAILIGKLLFVEKADAVNAIEYIDRMSEESKLYFQHKAMKRRDVAKFLTVPKFAKMTKGVQGGLNII